MKEMDDWTLVNYCYPGCKPLLNIMRLPKEDAFSLAGVLAKSHPETTAFYRFTDFENYYVLRMKQDQYLYSRFQELGGKPEEEHPLSFVVEGCDYLSQWFGNGVETTLRLKDIASDHISFTIGDSGAEFEKHGFVELLTVDTLCQQLQAYDGDVGAFLQSKGKHYIEVQLWSDQYMN